MMARLTIRKESGHKDHFEADVAVAGQLDYYRADRCWMQWPGRSFPDAYAVSHIYARTNRNTGQTDRPTAR